MGLGRGKLLLKNSYSYNHFLNKTQSGLSQHILCTNCEKQVLLKGGGSEFTK